MIHVIILQIARLRKRQKQKTNYVKAFKYVKAHV